MFIVYVSFIFLLFPFPIVLEYSTRMHIFRMRGKENFLFKKKKKNHPKPKARAISFRLARGRHLGDV